MPPDGPDTWPEADSKKQWLVFYKLDGMTFTGKGTIEGNGQKWWDLPCKPHRVFCLFDVVFVIPLSLSRKMKCSLNAINM